MIHTARLSPREFAKRAAKFNAARLEPPKHYHAAGPFDWQRKASKARAAGGQREYRDLRTKRLKRGKSKMQPGHDVSFAQCTARLGMTTIEFTEMASSIYFGPCFLIGNKAYGIA